MARRRRAARRGRKSSGFSALLERMSQSFDRFSAALEAAMAQGEAAASPQANDTAAAEGSPLDNGPALSADGEHGPPGAAEAERYGATGFRHAPGELPDATSAIEVEATASPTGAGRSPLAALAGAAMPSPSEGLASLQSLARDTATGSRQAEQIRIAREQLAEQKKTNQHLERQQSSSPAVFGP